MVFSWLFPSRIYGLYSINGIQLLHREVQNVFRQRQVFNGTLGLFLPFKIFTLFRTLITFIIPENIRPKTIFFNFLVPWTSTLESLLSFYFLWKKVHFWNSYIIFNERISSMTTNQFEIFHFIQTSSWWKR